MVEIDSFGNELYRELQVSFGTMPQRMYLRGNNPVCTRGLLLRQQAGPLEDVTKSVSNGYTEGNLSSRDDTSAVSALRPCTSKDGSSHAFLKK